MPPTDDPSNGTTIPPMDGSERPDDSPARPDAVAEAEAVASEEEFAEPPPRPTTPPVRMGFIKVLLFLLMLSALVYGIPVLVGRAGYAWEAGRSRAALEALEKLGDGDVQDRSSALFRLATRAVAPAVVNVRKTVNSTQSGGGDGIGSGVVIDKERGYVVTNHHVIRDADKIEVRVGQSKVVEAKLVGSDEKTDLAVLQIPGPLAVQAEWGDSDQVDVGDWVIAIGSPFQLDRTVTAGIVSATARNNLLPGDVYEEFIQTDAPINPGNSGGPLVDMRGRVIGINTAIFAPQGGYGGQGIGFAISSSLARRVTDQLIKNKRVIRGYIGILPDFSKVDDPPSGVPIAAVRPGSPAAAAGLVPGDKIVGFDGKPIADFSTLRNRTFTLPIGQEVPIEFERGGEKKRVTAKIAEMPSFASKNYERLGLDLRELPGLDGGGLIITAVRAGGPADLSGFRPGLLITNVGRRDVRSLEEFDRAIERFDLVRGIPLGVMAGDGRRAVINLNALGPRQ
ncbi:MAG: trypsin-like peptidase domain-containing protein [Isosphaeraceae bacterium]|nr:trypsin-like peptidase domain-containing protein [Isosphaeraceae bacterium]